MSKFFIVFERILLTLWVGGLWITGYLVVPALFATLDSRMLAGDLAGRIFTLTGWLGLACGALLLLSVILQSGTHWLRAWRLWVLAAMLLIVAVGLFVLQPQMQALKVQGIVGGSVQAAEFGRLHGVSSILFMLNSILGLVLVSAGIRPPR